MSGATVGFPCVGIDALARGTIWIRTRQVSVPRNLPLQHLAVTDGGDPVEPQLENESAGTEHGYPMPDTDPIDEEHQQFRSFTLAVVLGVMPRSARPHARQRTL